jgi:hypothetical protein
MAEKRKSIVDQSLIEAEQIREAFEVNAKEILTHAMGSEIEQMVKESLEEDFDLEDDNEEATDLDMSDEGGETEFDLDLDDEGEDNIDMELDIEFDDEEGDEIDLDIDTDDDDEIDLGGTMDTDMGDEIELDMDGMDGDMDLEIEDEMEALGEGTIYEIELDEYISEDDMEDLPHSRYDDEDEISNGGPDWNLPRSEREKREPRNMRGEASRTLGNGKKWGRKGLNKPTTAPRHLRQESEKPRISKLLKENTVLKTDMKTEQSKVQELTENNEKLVGGLKLLRKKLQEVAVFNSNLTYSVRLMTENATTSDEKVNIIKRMDEAKTLKESKNLYKSIVNELGKPSTTTTIKESVENKLNETKSSGSAAQISESKVYVNPELAKMRELMNFTHYNK